MKKRNSERERERERVRVRIKEIWACKKERKKERKKEVWNEGEVRYYYSFNDTGRARINMPTVE
jgi:hypothetical protein